MSGGEPGPEASSARQPDPGFGAGGAADQMPPGPVLTGLAEEAWQQGLNKLTDDELIGVLRAARRLASRAAARVRPARRGRFSHAGGHAGRPASHPVVPDRDRRGGQAGRARVRPAWPAHRHQPTGEYPARFA